MNIDYQAIATEAADSHNTYPISAGQAKAVIDAYEAHKKALEWVPFDLDRVKQGQEVRHSQWPDDVKSHVFVSKYPGGFFTYESRMGGFMRTFDEGWLMRATDKS